MKKLLLGSVSLLLFSCAILLFQISCKKDAQAQTLSAANQIDKLIYATYDGRIFTSNYDGSNSVQVNLVLPVNIVVDMSYPRFSIRMSPDGQKIFFSGRNTVTSDMAIYSADISGTNVVQILAGTPGSNQPDQPVLCGAY